MILPTASRAIAEAIARPFEGCVPHAYLDSGRPPRWTIGRGNRCLLDGSPVTAATKPITQATADALYDHAMGLVEPNFGVVIRVPVSAQEAGALLSMTYNIGSGAMAGSNVMRLLNAGDRVGAAAHMLDWDHTGAVVSEGLLLRRQTERAVFLGLLNPLLPMAGQGVRPAAETTADLNDASAAGTFTIGAA